MHPFRIFLATALLTASFSAALNNAAAACASLPPPPPASAPEEVDRYSAAGQVLMTCLAEEFESSRDLLSHHEKAQLIARMNALEYKLEQARLAAEVAARRQGMPTQAAEVSSNLELAQ